MLRRTDLRRLLDQGDPALDTLPPDGAHGAVMVERLRFGPPETWRGWRRGIGAVVVKLYPPGTPMPPDLAAMAGFRHPGVAPLLDYGEDWTIHPWVAGRTLDTVPTPEVVAAIAAAVAALHRAGLAHGDLTPANIVRTGAGPVLIDWGVPGPGTPGWRPDGPHGPAERDRFALARLAGLRP